MEPNIRPSNSFWKRLQTNVVKRVKAWMASSTTEERIRRRRSTITLITRRISWLQLGLLLIGYMWLAVIPSPYLGRSTYIDENALQPGQVNTYWNWGDVHAADRYLAKLEGLRDSNATSEQRARFMRDEFQRLGISSSTQNYTFTARSGAIDGTNAYGLLASPRSPGTEAMVISASWLSRAGGGTLNLRGVSTVLALAGFLKHYSLWAKDIVFVVSDGYLDGMQAWLAAYHGSCQSNLHADHLDLPSGVIWTALNVDYPGHSFSHLGIFFEGVNGRLPNQDLLNSFQRISRYTGGVPVVMYDHLDPPEHPDRQYLSGVPDWISNSIHNHAEIKAYAYQAKNIARHVGYQARGQPSGVHGLFHQYRIDAITLFALPATGPHGFHAIGRIIESTLRTTNNLLERLHASFFFYILTCADRFMKIGTYLPSAVLIGVATMFKGLQAWADAAWYQEISMRQVAAQNLYKRTWSRRPRPVLTALAIIITTHISGAFLFTLVTSAWFRRSHEVASPLIFALFSLIPLVALCVRSKGPEHGSLSAVLKALNLCFASTVISTISVLNFSLAGFLAVSLGAPLFCSSANGPLFLRIIKQAGYAVLGLGWLFLEDETLKAIWHWEILSVWFAPFICLVYVPLVLQAGIVCLLPL